jgi:tRNA 2-selenouridine synthase
LLVSVFVPSWQIISTRKERRILAQMLSIDDFLTRRNQLPVLDVRSEGEYEQGHVPNAINIPILNNDERKIVGTIYKQQGSKQAIKEGVRLVGPRLIEILEKAEQVVSNKEALVYCWRGGMRSNNFCWLIERLGIKAQPLAGGYKAYRKKALESFETPIQFLVLSGSTGSGKTEILQELKRQGEQIICLETIANHKGSAFGGLGLSDQPTTEQFQNNLFEEILQLDLSKRIWVEDESIAIGKIFIPQPLWKNLRNSPMVKVEVPKEVRVQRLVKDYGAVDTSLLLGAMQNISAKLGGQHFNIAREKLFKGDLADTADSLLTYYDKAYDKAITAREKQIVKKESFDWKDVNGFVKRITNNE